MDQVEVRDPEVTPLAAPTLKWASWPGNNAMNVPATTAQVGNITGTGTGGQAPGAIAVGDLLIVAAHAGKAGGINEYTISGSGWNLILHPTAGDDEIKIFVWWKNADASDVTAAGVYTVTWGGTLPEAWSWAEWNFGQNAFIDAYNGIWSNVVVAANGLCVAPACFPTGAADTLLTYWFCYHCNTNWVLPGGLTTVFNNTQGGLPSQGASGTKTLAAAGFTGNLSANIGIGQQFGALQITISTGAPPSGGGGNSPIKWLSFMATQPTLGTVSSVVIGTTAVAQTLGPFAIGDLYVVAVSVEADTGVTGALSISGTGWTNLVATSVGPLNSRMSVWAKVVGGGETGTYTVSWPNATGNPTWMAWNLGQATIDLAAGQCLAPTGTSLVAPTITTTAANEALLAYWFLVDTTGPGVGIAMPTPAGFTPLAINLTASFKWDVSSGVMLVPTAGATGNLTATGPTGMPIYSAFQLAYKPTTGVTPPSPPTGLTATPFSSTQINLSWTASSGATSYVVLRGGTSVGTPSGTTFNDTGLTPSTAYTYTVEAVNSGGTSSPSSPASATTPAGGVAPAAPTGLSATAVASSQINLSWTASSGATSYIVLRGATQVGTPSSTIFSDTGLAASTSYTYTVKAVNSNGTSAASSPASATTLSAGASLFPQFTVIVPPPLIGQGGGPPPTFPPTSGTAPVPIPPGILVGPAIAFPTVIAGKALIIFGTGSATAPTMVSWFPSFTTTFPSPTFVVSNVWTIPTLSGGVWTTHLPARTATTAPIAIGGWGSPGPSGSGPGPPTYPNPPGAGVPFMAGMAMNENAPTTTNESESAGAVAEIPRRRRRASA